MEDDCAHLYAGDPLLESAEEQLRGQMTGGSLDCLPSLVP